MEPLENNAAKALIIVEGEKLEPRFFKQYTKVFGINLEVYVVGANIYDLYNKLKSYDFSCDIKDVLPECGNVIETNGAILKQKFAYTYLVFDFDAHHREIGLEKLGIDEIVQQNINKLRIMADYFTNETDPSVGKLYINYPMMESYRACDAFFEEAYSDNIVSIDDIARFKSIAGTKKLASVHIEKYTKDNFSDLTRMNVYKLHKVINNEWTALPYSEYIELSEGAEILTCQAHKVEEERAVDVLNTSLFIALDYFGNRNGFYDGVVLEEERSSSKELQTV